MGKQEFIQALTSIYQSSKLNLKLSFETQSFNPKISISTIVFLQSLLVYCSQDYIFKTSVMDIIKPPNHCIKVKWEGMKMYLHSMHQVIVMLLFTESTENVFKSSELLFLLKTTHLSCQPMKYRKNFPISSCKIWKSFKALLGTREKLLRLYLYQKSQEVISS